MSKVLPLFLILLMVAACSTYSDSTPDAEVTLTIVHGWCMPACKTTFTITPEETVYKEINHGEDPINEYSAKTDSKDWQQIAFYLRSTNYRNIQTEPTCGVCVDGNDLILDIREGRSDKTIYYTDDEKVASIEDFMDDLYEMRGDFVEMFEEQ